MTLTLTIKVNDETARAIEKWLVSRQKSGLIKNGLTATQEEMVIGGLVDYLFLNAEKTGVL